MQAAQTSIGGVGPPGAGWEDAFQPGPGGQPGRCFQAGLRPSESYANISAKSSSSDLTAQPSRIDR